MKNSLVIFYSQNVDEEIIGFQIFSSKEAIKFKKALNLLRENESTYEFGGDQFLWKDTNIQIRPLSTAEIKTLNNIFDMDYQNGNSKAIGFIPNAIDQAQDQELMDEDGKTISLFGDQYQDDQDQEQEEDYY